MAAARFPDVARALDEQLRRPRGDFADPPPHQRPRKRSSVVTAQRAWVEQHATAERLGTAMEAIYVTHATRNSRTAKPAAASWTA